MQIQIDGSDGRYLVQALIEKKQKEQRIAEGSGAKVKRRSPARRVCSVSARSK
jgi:hypothetical protein